VKSFSLVAYYIVVYCIIVCCCAVFLIRHRPVSKSTGKISVKRLLVQTSPMTSILKTLMCLMVTSVYNVYVS